VNSITRGATGKQRGGLSEKKRSRKFFKAKVLREGKLLMKQDKRPEGGEERKIRGWGEQQKEKGGERPLEVGAKNCNYRRKIDGWA